jgi:hypothetical protein
MATRKPGDEDRKKGSEPVEKSPVTGKGGGGGDSDVPTSGE